MFNGKSSQPEMEPIKNYQTQSNEGSNPTQWSLNPTAYQNVANDQVDWAALAQQWIQMKETYPPELVPAAPPPPPLFTKDLKDYEEKGEAPMEVEKDDESDMHNGNGTNWSTGNGSNNDPLSPWNITFNSNSQWRTAWNSWNAGTLNPTQETLTTNVRQNLLTAPATTIIPPLMSTPVPEYWTPSSSTSRNSRSTSETRREQKEKDDTDDDNLSALDAAKRKSLPAWIREGLEKMEREKQKQEDRERERREREAMLKRRRQAEEEAMKELEKETMIPRKSKFESDSDDDNEQNPPIPIEHEKFSDIVGKQNPSPQLHQIPPYRSHDEIIQDLMLAVRKNLTEILLEVTNEEIFDIATETIFKFRKKAPTAQTLRKTALTSSLSGGLGLGVYGDSSDDSDSNDDEIKGNDGNDSEIEIIERIKRRKAAFEKTAYEIENQIAEETEREERKRRERDIILSQQHQNDDSDNDDIDIGKRKQQNDKDGETHQHDKNNIKYGRSREKKPSRFSDPRDTVRNVQTHVQFLGSQPPFKPSSIKLNDNSSHHNNSSNSSSKSSSPEIKQQHHHHHHRSSNKKHKKSSHKRKKSKYSDDSENSIDTKERSRSRERDYRSRSERSEESQRSSRDKRDRSRSRSRDRYHSKSSNSSKKSSSRHYDYKRRSRSRSHDHKRSYKSNSKERHSSYRSESRSKDKLSSTSSTAKQY